MIPIAAVLAGMAFAFDFDPTGPDFWRIDNYDRQSELTVVVLRVKDVPATERAVLEACKPANCAAANPPHWYYTGSDDIRTSHERYFQLPKKKAAKLVDKLLAMGEPLQFKRIGMRDALTQTGLEILLEKRRNLTAELGRLRKVSPPVPTIIALVETELSSIKSQLEEADAAKDLALVNLRLSGPDR